DRVFIEDIEIGVITSGAYSPVLGRSIAQAYVDVRHALLGMKVEVERKGKRYSAKIVEPPFVQPISMLGKPVL
ncbi:MAG TPA: glycine cleavage system protein T, partial [Pyrodictium sp.]|nr:glycine cleavage system protein T [Pyrodictium sp.]